MPRVAPAAPSPTERRDRDQRVFMHDGAWSDFETVLRIRGDRPVPRITYLERELELMAPSRGHEETKKTVARLVEAWADERSIPLQGIGSWTLKNRRRKRAAEPDECYEVGETPKDRLDLAIDVYVLRDLRYERVERSEVLPDFDFELLLACLTEPTQARAVRRLRTALRGR